MSRMEYKDNIVNIRAVEDCIRATHQYTEGIRTIRAKHPVQGDDFPSKVFCKYYEVYPGVELNWDMPAGKAMDLIWGDTLIIDMVFKYDYRDNLASVIIKNGEDTLDVLKKAIPGIVEALEVTCTGNGNGSK